ncbi:phosphoenolpyruvate--protein phosphotransferase [Chlamydia pneumoniae]|uniref:Phosphoenolpyruvate-protein phosphotransferase n=3 Tax=Chlamydia pneumoniae TaxID=83558 RepID=PT1_CHLPN|nr:phosphoenolpyruvate--protein phosphotransferase [Chlamydia pneumoniae]Q9Z9E3.2 RecName: Full=Phosphoenolpyruvate-protein phosphotransferase; AltName: Full=Phosphotransferase system, enzyme I [Chlamydia pneumoniae]AAF38542.1 phosphoenolpyruvate-protein phosphotransferase [Chlamydia pneumoniae AR39]CRI35394.1 Phosphoenolpyruvate-protein phosphotransferase [Chlamydia pneumoniae]CRI41041.1 Phosphoenolpyruvate-protein phosphotransferase [Chlamydia pneumoniae]CRI72676.1 Phosphoenolpyruvate-protei
MDTQSSIGNEEWRIAGTSVVSGMALGKVFFLGTSPLHVRELTLPQEEVEHEIHRYYKALNRSKSDIVALEQEVTGQQGLQEVSSILQAHLEIMKDPLLTEEVVNTIRKDRKNAEYVFSSVMGKIEESLTAVRGMPSVVDRVQDIHDISNRVIGHLCCQHKSSLGESDQNLIIFSEELTPSEVASANSAYIRGFVSLVGAATSHTAIVSRAKSIPYLANISEELWNIAKRYNGKLVLIDGYRGELIFNPKPATLQSCYKKELSVVAHTSQRLVRKSLHPIVSSHAGSDKDVEDLLENFPQTSIGLFRSEFLAVILGRLPTLREQVDLYEKLARFPGDSPSVLRLFDFGEDKPCPGIKNKKERSIRWLLDYSVILEDQLQAIAKASLQGSIKVLIPGVSDVSEIIEVKKKWETIQTRFPKGHKVSWGTMIEFPSAVWMIEEILPECDFLSIGTNDLVQYTLGISRESALPKHLNVTLPPAVIRMIHHVLQAAKQNQVPVSICGEAAGQLSLTPLFIGLGVQELSVAMPVINRLRNHIALLELNSCLEITEALLQAKTCSEVEELLNRNNKITS